MYAKVCKFCGKTFILRKVRANQREFCNSRCSSRAYNKYRKVDKFAPTSTVGTVSELLTCAYLLKMGYSVFRSVSPSCSCDLIAIRDAEMLRVEVTTGYQRTDGKIQHCKAKQVKKFDLLCVAVRPDWRIFVFENLNGELKERLLTPGTPKD